MERSFQCPVPSLTLVSIQSLNLLTILFYPGVKLLPQVDDFNAKTLLTVRPLQVVIKPFGQAHML